MEVYIHFLKEISVNFSNKALNIVSLPKCRLWENAINIFMALFIFMSNKYFIKNLKT
jgi:hypothetical protein